MYKGGGPHPNETAPLKITQAPETSPSDVKASLGCYQLYRAQ